MGEELHTGVCSGSWWNATRGGIEEQPTSSMEQPTVSCSAAVSDVGSFRWTMEMLESKARSGDESTASVSGGSTVTFHGTPMVRASDPMTGDGFLLEPTVAVVGSGFSSPSMDWNQAFLRSNRRVEGGVHAMPHDHLSSRAYLGQEASMESYKGHLGVGNSGYVFKDYNQGFMTGQPRLNPGTGGSGDDAGNGFQGVSFASTLLHGLVHQDMRSTSPSLDTACSTNLVSPRFPQFFKASSPKPQQSPGQLQFSNDTQFWNASAAAGNSVRTGFCSSTQTQFFTQQEFEGKPRPGNTAGKSDSEGTRDSSSVAMMKKSVNEPTSKKPRIETPSPLPTFKVRKEKLGDRITALQQLVSPFGKTDTASVLHEAIEYIKFLHDQVGVLSTPYLKNGSVIQYQETSENSEDNDGPKRDLKSRGLCLVPISHTFPVINEPTADFWTPTFGGTYR